jgi:hypothetical protein
MFILSYIFNNLLISLFLLFPLIYVFKNKQALRFCKNNLPNQLTNFINFVTFESDELFFRCVIYFYSLVFTIFIFELFISFFIIILS